MSLGSIAQYTKEIAEPLKGFVQAVADPSKFLDKIKAYGNIGRDGEYFCDTTNIGVEKRMYGEEVANFNNGIEFYKNTHPGASEEQIAEHIYKGIANSDINSMAECLAETHGVDPDTVAQFSSQMKDALSYNLEVLYTIAPDLGEHVDVPFTGDAIGALILSSAVLGTVYGITKLRGRFGNLFDMKI